MFCIFELFLFRLFFFWFLFFFLPNWLVESRVAMTQEVVQVVHLILTKVGGSISSSLHVELFLGKTLNPGGCVILYMWLTPQTHEKFAP